MRCIRLPRIRAELSSTAEVLYMRLMHLQGVMVVRRRDLHAVKAEIAQLQHDVLQRRTSMVHSTHPQTEPRLPRSFLCFPFLLGFTEVVSNVSV